MKKFGGPGRKKKCCTERKCLQKGKYYALHYLATQDGNVGATDGVQADPSSHSGTGATAVQQAGKHF
jgi:hypothetical protein